LLIIEKKGDFYDWQYTTDLEGNEVGRTNNCMFLVDFSQTKYFGETSLSKDKKIPFARFYGHVPEADGVRPVRGIKFVAYGYRAELAYAFIEQGTRAYVFCHLQMREEFDKIVVEFVMDDVQYIKNFNKEEGQKKKNELVARGILKPSSFSDIVDHEADNESKQQDE